jgi:hypothetical protein
MRWIGSVIIGAVLSLLGIDVYSLKTNTFSLLNLFILVVVVILWNFVYDAFKRIEED